MTATPDQQTPSPEQMFWRWFQENQDMLLAVEHDEHVFDLVAANLARVDDGLTFEFGPRHSHRREFIVSADGVLATFGAVERLTATIPELPRWNVVRFRPRRPPCDVQVNDIEVKAGSVRAVLQRHGDKAVATFHIPGYRVAERETYRFISVLMLHDAIGEFDATTRVSGVDVAAASPQRGDAVPLARLAEAFDALFR